MKFLLIIVLLCKGVECDRIAQPTEKCGDEAHQLFEAEAILAQTGLYDGSQTIQVHCESVRTK